MKLRSFASVVNHICSVNLDDDSGKLRGKVSQALRACLDEFGAHLPTPIRSNYFTVSDSLTIALPTEVSQVTKVGTMCNGAWTLMSRNESVRRVTIEACSCSDTAGESCAACTFYNVPMGATALGELYGVKANGIQRAEFRYNRDENRLEFGSGVSSGDQILVEYKTVGSDEDLALIPGEWVNMIGFYVAFAVNQQHRSGVAANNYAAFQSSWNALKAANNPYTGKELIAALMGESMPAPKN